tara:strand:- start:583 stop:1029 length:447 start_codon:yes stop_codon:yes gene_type:complete
MNTNPITKTTNSKLLLIPRLLAGLPMLGFGMIHFVKPDHFRDILLASGIPMVNVSLYAAPVALVIGAVLLLLGLFARVGGLLGIATMAVAIYSTVILSSMAVADLPIGLTEVPTVPPLPLPVVVTVASLIVLVRGAGHWSLDLKNQSK